MLYVIGIYVLSVLLFPRTAGHLTARLVNGTSYAGRLEILYNGAWSTVCDDNFGNDDAQVVCRMLGLYSPGAVAVPSNMYGAGQGSILLDEVNCRGTETNLEQCIHGGYYSHDCGHNEDIGVICNIPGQLTARLVNGTRWAGRLEILYNGTWSTVCDDNFGNTDAQVACNMLSSNSAGALAVSSATYGAGEGSILLDDVNCNGTESSLAQCSHSGYYNHNCLHNEDVGVVCNAQSCRDWQKRGVESGVYSVITADVSSKVWCDMDHGGGWLVFQRRRDGSVDFYRNWRDYEQGFGDVTGEFWLGLYKIHKLTQGRPHRLRVDLVEVNGESHYAEYSSFSVDGPVTNYTLHVSGYSGNAGDSLLVHNNQDFTTYDRNNDKATTTNCAVAYHGAWWYKACHSSNLNGRYKSNGAGGGDSLAWWYAHNDNRGFTFTEMKFKPV